MTLDHISDEDLEARLRRLAADEFNAELVIDQLPNGEWRARCMDEKSELGPANLFSSEGARTRRGVLEALWQSFELKHVLDARRGGQ